MASGTTASLAFSKANTAGNLIVVYVVWDNPGTVTVSDTSGDLHGCYGAPVLGERLECPGLLRLEHPRRVEHGQGDLWYGDHLFRHRVPARVLRSRHGVSRRRQCVCCRHVGVHEQWTATTTQANDLLFAAGASANTVTTPGTGFTQRLTGFGNLTEDRVVTTTGSYAGTASQNGSTWVMQLVAFRVASTFIGPPTKLAFVQGPSNTVAGAAMTPAVKVAVEDANGNIETSDNADQVSLAIGTNPAGGTLSGGSAVTVASGVATFSGLSINTAGTGYTLTASSTPAFSGATSATFNITHRRTGRHTWGAMTGPVSPPMKRVQPDLRPESGPGMADV